MKQMGAASRKKLNIALLILLLVALVVLAAVLFVRAKPDAVSPDNRIETAEPLSLTLPRTALSAIFDDAASPQMGGYSAVPLTATVEFKGNHAAMTASGMLPGDSEEKTFTVTATDASKLAGQDIKTCAASASELQNLLNELGF